MDGETIDIYSRNEHGETQLHLAKTIEETELLIKHGADVNARDYCCITPLHWAVTIEQTELLIKNGADVNATSIDYETPLHFTKTTQQTILLIKHGADVNAISVQGRNPLFFANSEEHKKILIINGSVPCSIRFYEEHRHLFPEYQQVLFDAYKAITSNDEQFFSMCKESVAQKNKKVDTPFIKEVELDIS